MIECICHIAHVRDSTRSGAAQSDLMLARAVYVNHETERLNRNDQERERKGVGERERERHGDSPRALALPLPHSFPLNRE